MTPEKRGSKLLSINNYYYRRGGAETIFFEHNRLFEEVGWDVIPFAMSHPKNEKSEWDKFFVDEIECGHGYSIMEKIGMLHKVVFSFEARKKILALIDVTQPDIAHAHNIYHHISPSIFTALKNRGIPTVLTLHDLKIACPAYKMLSADGICERCNGGKIWNVVQHKCIKGSYALSALIMLEAATNKFIGSYSNGVCRFIVPSRFFLEKFVEWGFPREKFVHIPNFVNVDRLTPSGIPGRHFVYFGRLSTEKGLETFVRAVAHSQTKAKIIGTGPEEERLRQLASIVGADIEFLGYKSGEALFNCIRSARAVVVPSEWYENAPVSIMEAYALERPIIGANIGGIPELLKAGETGALFQPGNVEELSERLLQMASRTDAEVHNMGRAGREWMKNNFTESIYRERLLKLYEEVKLAV
jgi:glycosyltransferase involved in cell wall biosynthesis